MSYTQSKGGILMPREPFVPGTVKPEADYEEFSRLGAKLGLPCPQAHISLESLGPDGELHDWHHDRSRTLNRNYWNYLFKLFALFNNNAGTANFALAADTTYGAGHLTNKNTSGTVLNANSTGFNYAPWVNGAATTQGIVVGTGTTAESFEGFVLATETAHGNAAGQLFRQAMTMTTTPTYTSGTLTWAAVTTRIFNNNSGGTIVVAETGIYADNNSNKVMLMRDLLGATVSVLNGGQLTVNYTMTLTFPA